MSKFFLIVFLTTITLLLCGCTSPQTVHNQTIATSSPPVPNRTFHSGAMVFTMDPQAVGKMRHVETLVERENQRMWIEWRNEGVRKKEKSLGRTLTFDERGREFENLKMRWIYELNAQDREEKILALFAETDVNGDFHISTQEAEEKLQEFRSKLLSSLK